MKKSIVSIALAALGLCSQIQATQYMPWFGNDKEGELRLNYNYDWFSKLKTGTTSTTFESKNHLLNSSFAISPFPSWAGEVEIDMAKTSTRSFGYDAAKLTGRYQLMNDIVGDPFSLVVGGTATAPSGTSLKDRALMHQGDFNFEGHASIGQEYAKGRNWMYRYWGLAGLGLANRGSAWMHFSGAFERNMEDVHSWQVGFNSLWGFSSNNLVGTGAFDGYHSVGYENVDLTFRYTRAFVWHGAYWGTLSGEIGRRIHAKNCPTGVNHIQLGYFLPFSPIVL